MQRRKTIEYFTEGNNALHNTDNIIDLEYYRECRQLIDRLDQSLEAKAQQPPTYTRKIIDRYYAQAEKLEEMEKEVKHLKSTLKKINSNLPKASFSDIFIPNDTQEINMQDLRNKILDHHYSIYGQPKVRKGYKGKADRFTTRLPIPTGNRKDKEVAKVNIEDLEDTIVAYYIDQKDGAIVSNVSTFEQVFHSWAYYKFSQCGVSSGTLKKYNDIFKRCYCKNKRWNKQDHRIKSMQIGKITTADLEEFLSEIVRKQRPYKTLFTNIVTDLKGVFDYAYKQRLIVENPTTYLDTRKYNKRLVSKSESKKRAEIVPRADRKKLLEYCNSLLQTQPNEIRPLILMFYVFTGCRTSEPLALKWENVFLEDNDPYLMIENSIKDIDGVWQLSTTKNGQTRALPIDDNLKSILLKAKEVQQSKNKGGKLSEYVFNNALHTFYTPKQIEYFMKKTCEKINVSITATKLRKTLNTELANSGVPAFQRCKILGNTEATNSHYYTNFSSDTIFSNMDKYHALEKVNNY